MTIDLSPEQFRELGYRAVDILASQLADVQSADSPVRRTFPPELRAQLLEQPLPESSKDAGELLDVFAYNILPYPMGNASPRFFAWVNSTPAPLGVLADFLASGLNSSVAGGDHAATYVEHGVLNWLKEIMRFPATSGGILTSGGTMANLTGLAVMRHVKTQGTIRQQGLQTNAAPMVIYQSEQGHSCIQKSAELLGFGNDYLRKIPVDADYRMDVGALKAQIAADRAAGLSPICVVASAGTVNTGAVDPLDAIADVCAAEGLWFHIDAAYGGTGILAEQSGDLFAGIERADSIAIDPHKWMFIPLECGCALVKDAVAMRDTFSLVPPYLRDDTVLPWFSEFGFQQTRGFKALKLWMVMQQIGVNGYRELITQNVALTRTLQARIAARDDFELVAAGPLSVSCFRYAPPDMSADDTDTLNRELLKIVQREGKVFLISTELDGRPVLRACIVNFRTTEDDLDFLLDTIVEAGQRVISSQFSVVSNQANT